MPERIYYLSFDFGQLSIHTHEIIANMLKSGSQVELFLPEKVPMYFNIHQGCNIHEIPAAHNNRLVGSIIFHLLLGLALCLSCAKTGKPDLIYARQNYMGIIVIILARILKIPYFAEINGIVANSENEYSSTKSKYKKILENQCFRLANIIIVPSDTLKQRIISRYHLEPGKIFSVPNGVNEILFHPDAMKKGLAEKLGFRVDDFIVGFVGSMGKWQGINVLLEAIKLTRCIDEQIKLLLVGDYVDDSDMSRLKTGRGDAAKKLIHLLKDTGLAKRVIYQPFVRYEESADYMKLCDVLVAPYTEEAVVYSGGSPMKLYAYLGCAKAVIISDLNGLTDSTALKNNNAACLVPPGDSLALMNAILQLKTSESLRKQLGENGRAFALRERRWANSSAKIMDIYRQQFNKLV